MTTYRALRVNQAGDITSAVEQVSIDELGANEVLIDAEYSSINYKDALAMTGKSRIMRRYPTVAGIDVAGVIEQSNDERFTVGDKVLVTGCGLGETQDGGLAEKVRVSADYVVPLPESLDCRDAMILGTAGFTAGLAVLRMMENRQTPDMGKILVTGATGGVGSVAIRYLHKLGFDVAALTGKPEEAKAYLSQLGADEIVDRTQLEMGTRPLESTVYAGAIDNVGGETLSWMTRVMSPEGNIASCGLAGGIELNGTVMPFILRGVNLLGINSVTQPMTERIKVWEQLAATLDTGDLGMFVKEEIALDQVVQKAGDLMDGAMIGRYLVNLKK